MRVVHHPRSDVHTANLPLDSLPCGIQRAGRHIQGFVHNLPLTSNRCFQQQTCLVRRPRTQFRDPEPALICRPRNHCIRMSRKDATLRPRQVVFRPFRDLVEQQRSGGIVKEPRRKPLGFGSKARAHGRGYSFVNRKVVGDLSFSDRFLNVYSSRGEYESCHQVLWMRLYP